MAPAGVVAATLEELGPEGASRTRGHSGRDNGAMRRAVFTDTGMLRTRTPPRVQRELGRILAALGEAIRAERRRRGLTLAELAPMVGLSKAGLARIEHGEAGSIGAYLRLADALHLEPQFALTRLRAPLVARQADAVHAAMGELEAARLRAAGLMVAMDEPFQDYHFAGRADVVAWSIERRALVHFENKTAFPDLQDAFGSFNAKRAYLGRALAERVGVAAWRAETHVIASLWSAEVLHQIRLHQASFAAVCPDPVAAVQAWWSGNPSPAGARCLILLDPLASGRQERFAGLDRIESVRPRYRDYADAAEALRTARR